MLKILTLLGTGIFILFFSFLKAYEITYKNSINAMLYTHAFIYYTHTQMQKSANAILKIAQLTPQKKSRLSWLFLFVKRVT